MALLLKDNIAFGNGIELKNTYLSVRSFRQLSDIQMEVKIDLYVSAQAKYDGFEALKSQTLILDIDKQELSVSGVYNIIYDKIKSYYPSAIDITEDTKTDKPNLYNGLKNDTLSGTAIPESKINVKFHKHDAGSTVIADKDGMWNYEIQNIGTCIVAITAKAKGKKESDPVIIEIIQVKEREYTYIIK